MSALSFGDVSNTNSSRYYSFTWPTMPDGDWCVGLWTVPLAEPDHLVYSALTPFCTSASPSASAGISWYFSWYNSPANAGAMWASGTGGTPGSTGPFGAGAVAFNTTPTLLIVQRRAGNSEWYWAPKGSTQTGTAHSYTQAWTGAGLASNAATLGRDSASAYWWTWPLGEFFILNDQSLSLAQVNALAAGVQITTVARPIVWFPFRDGPAAVELNQGYGGAAYNATRSGTGFDVSTPDYFNVNSDAKIFLPRGMW